MKRRYAKENCYAKADIKPRHLRSDMVDIKERIAQIKQAEDILAALPGLNCGLCGAPDCRTLAADIALGISQKTDCVFFSKDRLEKLRRIHLNNKG